MTFSYISVIYSYLDVHVTEKVVSVNRT